MKFLFDLFPVILFFAAFKAFDIYVATVTVIVATGAQILWVWWRHGKVDTMLWISLALVAVFGGATLLLHDESFIKWKPTVLYWMFGGILLVSATFLKRNLIRSMLQNQVELPETVWTRLNLAWSVFFVFMGAANLFVASNYPTDTWVNFKLFGGMGLMMAFIVAQGLFLSKYLEDKK
jgi:intracellular septation protein